MKIICAGRNYRAHAAELGNEAPEAPVLFLKPETALLPKNHPFHIPSFTSDLHYEVEIVVRINRLGKHIQEKYAQKYYDEVGIGIDFTARDLQQQLKAKNLPWELAKAFDHSAPVGRPFVKLAELPDPNNIRFRLEKNQQIVQQGQSSDMIFSIDKLISYASRFFTLKIGDLLFTGTPAGVGAVQIGDQLTAFLEDKRLLDLRVH